MDVKEKAEIATLKDEISKQSELFTITDMKFLHAKLNIPTLVWNGKTEDLDMPLAKKRKIDENIVDFAEKGRVTGQIVCNKKLLEVVSIVKPEIIAMVDSCNKVKIWVQLMIPKIEDGNNFGVSIQEDVLGEVSKAESDAGSYLEQMSRYYSSRAKLVSKAAKYPELDDYRQAIKEYDEKVYLGFKLILRELRNIYVVLYDVIIKNFERLICPRNSHTSSLY